MSKKFAGRAVFSFLLFLLFLLAACSQNGAGAIPSGTPDHGDGTPSVLVTATSSQNQNVSSAPTSVLGSSYAFVRDKQLWVALHGSQPMQMTHFDYSKTPLVFWHQPTWSPDDTYIASITVAEPNAIGGGGCPAPDYGANGALYLLNTKTQQFTQITLPTIVNDAQASGTPRTDSWQYTFWQDSTHLLAWYNSGPGKTGTGLYRYDVQAKTLSLVLSVNALHVSTLYNPQQDTPLLLSMRYSSGQLFYQVVMNPFEQQSQLLLYSYSLTNPGAQSKKLLQMGSESWCGTTQAGAFVRPGWDVASDGQQLVAQVIVSSSQTQALSTVEALNLNDNSTVTLFSQVPTSSLNQDVSLTWGPDSQEVAITGNTMTAQVGLYSTSLADPTTVQRYAPNLAGQVTWRTDSTAFVLPNADALDTTTTPDIYVFSPGDAHGQRLLSNALDFTWG